MQPDRWNNKAHKLTWFLQRLTFMAEKVTSFENSGIVFLVVNGLSLWMKLRLRQRADVMTLYCYCAAIKQTALPTSKMKMCRPLQIWLLFLQRYNGRKLLFLSRLLMSSCWRKKSKRWRNECSPRKLLNNSALLHKCRNEGSSEMHQYYYFSF